jgi:hypothetical protein
VAIVNGGAADEGHVHCAGLETAGTRQIDVVITYSFSSDILVARNLPKRLQATPPPPLLLSYSLLYASF